MKKTVTIFLAILMLFTLFQGISAKSVVKGDSQNTWPVLNVGVVMFEDSIYNCSQVDNALNLWINSVKDDYERINRNVNISIHKVTKDTFDQVVFNSDVKIWMYIGDMKDVPIKEELLDSSEASPFPLSPTDADGRHVPGTLERGVVISSLAVPDADKDGNSYSNEEKLKMVLNALEHFTSYHNGSDSYRSFALGRIGFNPNETNMWGPERDSLSEKYKIERFIEGCFAGEDVKIGASSNDIFEYRNPAYATFRGHADPNAICCLSSYNGSSELTPENVAIISPAFVHLFGCWVNAFIRSSDGKYLGGNWASLVFNKGAVTVYAWGGLNDLFDVRPAIIRGYSIAESILLYPKAYDINGYYEWVSGSLFGDPTLRLVDHPLRDDRENLPPSIEINGRNYRCCETNSSIDVTFVTYDPENDPVSISIVSAPPEVEVHSMPGYSNKWVQISSSTPGIYEIKFGATDNQEGRELNTVPVFVTFADEPVPELLSPLNGAKDIFIRPKLWVDYFDNNVIVNYRVQLASDPNFSNVILDQNIVFIPSFVQVPFDLSYSTTYYWRAQRVDGNNVSPWSSVWSFTTMSNPNGSPPPKIQLISPPNNSTGVFIRPTLSWQDLGDECLYSLLLYSEDNSFELKIGGLSGNSVTLPKLESNKSYYWHLYSSTRSFFVSSERWKFTTGSSALPTPAIFNITPKTLVKSNSFDIEISGENFNEDTKFAISPPIGININSLHYISSTTLIVNVSVTEEAPLGLKDAEVVNSNGEFSVVRDAIVVVSPSTPSTLNHFEFSTISNQTANVPFNITITAKDQYGNTYTGFNSSVTLSVNKGTITPTTTTNFVNGLLSNFSVTIPDANTGVIITATASGKTSTSNSFDVANTQNSFSLHIPSEWSLISVPFDTDASLLSCQFVLSWDGSMWQLETLTLHPGRGYLVLSTTPTSRNVILTGTPLSSPFSLPSPGSWQLIGNPFASPCTLSSTSPILLIYFFDATSSTWQPADTNNLQPGMGYLVLTSSSGTFTFTVKP